MVRIFGQHAAQQVGQHRLKRGIGGEGCKTAEFDLAPQDVGIGQPLKRNAADREA